MKLQKIATYIGLIAGSALAMSTAPAQAASFTAQDAVNAGCVGKTTCTVNDFTLTAGPGSKQLTQKAGDNIVGLGVATDATKLNYKKGGDQSAGEIDVNETLGVSFTKGIVDYFDLSKLYTPEGRVGSTNYGKVYGDKVFEAALATPLGSLFSGTLTVTGKNTATWLFNGVSSVVENLSPSTLDHDGSYRVYNPFGDLAVTGFTLTAKDNPTVDGAKDSDFLLSGVKTTAVKNVPEPGTVAALLSVGAMAAFGKLRRRKGRAIKA